MGTQPGTTKGEWTRIQKGLAQLSEKLYHEQNGDPSEEALSEQS